MSHIAKSRILEEIIIALRKKDQIIPENVMKDLKSARTMMTITATKSDLGETEPKIDNYLKKAEAYLIIEADKYLPPEKVQSWLTQLDISSCDQCVPKEQTKPESRFIAGVPRDQKWVRVTPIEGMSVEMLQQMASETELGFREEKDGHLIVYGQPEGVLAFIKKMTKQASK